MKVRLNMYSEASALPMTLVVGLVISTTLAASLSMISTTHRSVSRSQAWNASITFVEAGVEEAMTRLEVGGINAYGNGWSLTGTVYQKSREFSDGSFTCKISTNDPPIITSTGLARLPSSSSYISRTVQVTTTNYPIFARGIIAKGNIDLNGNNIMSDSFDSSDPNYSLLGLYNPLATKDNGDIVTNSGLVDSLNVGNADIYGKVATGPGGSVKIGGAGSVGDKAWHAAGNRGVQPGRTADDMNIAFPDVGVPFNGGGLVPVSGTVNGVSYNYVLSGGNYQMSSLSMTASENMIVVGKSVLYIPGNVELKGAATITVAPGGSLQIFVGGESAEFSGTGVINKTGTAENLIYWGLPSNKTLKITGNSLSTVGIYAPSADLKLNPLGMNIIHDFVGSIVTKSVFIGGHFNFHYDEHLRLVGPKRSYIATSWLEI